jgi:hypothetical protein
MKARIAPMRRREAAPSALQSSAAICQVSTARPAGRAPAVTAASVCLIFSGVMPKLTRTPSAVVPALANAFGPDAATKTGLGRFTQGKCASLPRQEAGWPASKVRTNVVPAARSPIRDRPRPRLRVPL